MGKNLFVLEDFVSASGAVLKWKIECDALTDDDWKTIAAYALDRLPSFSRALGVPTGGAKLATILDQHKTSGPVLLVDDVWTTGQSMSRLAASLFGADYHAKVIGAHHGQWIGFVAFARGDLPANVRCFMKTYF